MSIEEKLFERKRFVPEAMLDIGFKKNDNIYIYEADFMEGDFSAILSVTEQGAVSGKVIDKMNGEEYVQLRVESFNGAYVNSVRGAYSDWLSAIASRCCEELLFVSGQANRIAALIMDEYAVSPDFPWGQGRYKGTGVFRHQDTRKWFALIMNVRRGDLLKNGDGETVDIINLKRGLAAETGGREEQLGIYPAYHMDHRHWISVMLGELQSDEAVMALVADSFRLT